MRGWRHGSGSSVRCVPDAGRSDRRTYIVVQLRLTSITIAMTVDGPFQVLIQNANVTPPANCTGNWLPGAQAFSFIGEFRTPCFSEERVLLTCE
jgi:hypothetical protein